MPGMTLTIDGLPEFASNMQAASVSFRPQLNQAMVQSVNAIKNDAQFNAPFITGTLRRSIQTEIEETVGIVYVDSDIAPYGRAIEFGTVGMTINVPNGRRTKYGRTRPYTFLGNIQPHLYLTQAFEANIEVVKNFFQQAILNVLKTAAGQ